MSTSCTAREVTFEFSDPAISGTDPLEGRPGFAALVNKCLDTDIRTILVERVDRFARSILVQELGLQFLREQQFSVILTDAPDLFTQGDPMSVFIRQLLGCVAEFHKSQIVAQLKSGRAKKLQAIGDDPNGRRDLKGAPKLTGRNAILAKSPELLKALKALLRKSKSRRQPYSPRKIGILLKQQDAKWCTSSGRPYGNSTICRWVDSLQGGKR